MRFRLHPVAFSLLCAFSPAAHADEEPLLLKLDDTFMELAKTDAATPTFISAQQLKGDKKNQVEASGDVELRKPGQSIRADRVLILQDSKQVIAEGSVRVEQDGNVISGPHLQLNLETNIGEMKQAKLLFGEKMARGTADILRIEGRNKYMLTNASYTTCPAGKDDWMLKMGDLEIDRSRHMGVAHHARVEFMGTPILYTPWIDFAFDDQRKSGFLSPQYGTTTKSGYEITLPYYWNIAPNFDATLSPRVMSKRGISLNNEVRYLNKAYSGEAHVNILPDDRIANRTRSMLTWTHSHNLGRGFTGSVNLNRVSDDAYFRDLSNAVNVTAQTNLLREGALYYGGGWWNASLRAQRYQTLQDPGAPIVMPYRRIPQITLNAQRVLANADMAFAGEFVDFLHPTTVSGRRLVLYPSVSYPLIARSAAYLTPKIGLHNTHYVLYANNTESLPNTQRTMPIFSLDSGIVLERDWDLAGQDFVQTLEPRAFYVYIPYRDQSRLPNFDSGQADFSVAQMFTENRFFGYDRIGDANQVTVALTSRLIEPASGAERLRFAAAQRFSLQAHKVNIAAPTATTNKSDIMLAAFGQVTPAWSLDSAFQYNPNDMHSEKYNLSLRYRPEAGKVLNMGYRFTRNTLRQVDLSTQWPLSGRWHAVARWNYSLQDRSILEALTGLEYNESCWTLRLVAQRFATATEEASTGFFVQLELNDLVRVGADPLSVLRQSVPGYTKLNQPSGDAPVQGLR
ncbi:LPS-assembly protein LptD [Gallionellaceae bacterium]|nr:LPS-assembly protein LptD [Gallionellaceae bacterium]